MQISRRESDGAWIVGLYNPWGAKRGDVSNIGSILDQGCTIHDVLRPKFPIANVRSVHAWPTGTGVTVRNGELLITVGPGGTLVVEITGRS